MKRVICDRCGTDTTGKGVVQHASEYGVDGDAAKALKALNNEYAALLMSRQNRMVKEYCVDCAILLATTFEIVGETNDR